MFESTTMELGLDKSQWSLTFEVRKSPCLDLEVRHADQVAMEPDL